MTENTLIFYDLETGGLEFYPVSLPDGRTIPMRPIIQFAAIAHDPDTCTNLETLECKIQFNEANADPKALEINHYTAEAWADALSPWDAWVRITNFINRHATRRLVSKRTGNPYKVAQPAGHNVAAFDLPFLQAWFKTISNAFIPLDYHPLDTLTLARAVEFLSGQTFPDLCAQARARGEENIRVQSQTTMTWDILSAEILVSRLEEWINDLDTQPVAGMQYDIAAANERTQQ